MSAETLLTAARRVVRFVRGDDAAHGGLLSLDTIRAAETLDRQVHKATEAIKQVGEFRITEDGPSPRRVR